MSPGKFEAGGHTVAALDHGQRIRSVSIPLPSDSLGDAYLRSLVSLDLSPPIWSAAKELLERRILTVLSGPTTECWFRGRRARGEASVFDAQLSEGIFRLHRDPGVACAYLQFLWARITAWLALSTTQRSINRIATALVAKGTLTGEQARNLWNHATTQLECPRPEPMPFPA